MNQAEIILLTSFPADTTPERLAEYQECLRRNAEYEHIGQIKLFLEGDERSRQSVAKPWKQCSKVQIIPINKRATHNQLFDYANQKLKEKYVVVCNGDIWFDQESNLDRIVEIRKGAMWALTRCKYDPVTNQWVVAFTGRRGSYDSYLFKSPIKEIDVGCELEMGRYGCDTYLASKALLSGIQVANPAYSIISKHLHDVAIKSHHWYSETHKKKMTYWELPDYGIIKRSPPLTRIEQEQYLKPRPKWQLLARYHLYRRPKSYIKLKF